MVCVEYYYLCRIILACVTLLSFNSLTNANELLRKVCVLCCKAYVHSHVNACIYSEIAGRLRDPLQTSTLSCFTVMNVGSP